MSLIPFEFLKIYSRRAIWGLLILCFLLNIYLINRQESEDAFRYPPSAYRTIVQDLEKMDAQDAFSLLQEKEMLLSAAYESSEPGDGPASAGYQLEYTDDLWQERELTGDCRDEIENILSFADRLDKMKADAENMMSVSIFKKSDGFSSRNIVKTASDFQDLRKIHLTYGASKGVKMATDFVGTDTLVLILLLLICMNLFFDERERGVSGLIRPTLRGRSDLAIAKIITLALSCLGLLLIFYGANLISAGLTYGFGDVFRPIQSISGRETCILLISVLGYLVLYGVSKLCVWLLIGLFISVMCLVWKNVAAIYLSVAGAFLAEALLYSLTPVNSLFSILRYVNFYFFLRTDGVVGQYLNVNLFGYPVHILPVFYIVCLTGAGILSAITIRRMCGNGVADKGASFHLPCAVRQLWRNRDRLSQDRRNRDRPNETRTGSPAAMRRGMLSSRKVRGVCYFEMLKSFRHGKAALILLLFVVTQIYGVLNFSIYQTPDDIYYRNYMHYLEGMATDEKASYLIREEARFAKMHAQLEIEKDYEKIARLQEDLLAEKGFARVRKQVQTVFVCDDAPAVSPWYVYADGYEALIGPESKMGLAGALKVILILILCLSPLFAQEYAIGMHRILHASPFGRDRTMAAKCLVAGLVSISVFLITNGADFISVLQKIGMGSFQGPIQSLPNFVNFPLPCAISDFLISIYILRFSGACFIACGILLISAHSNNHFTSMIVSTGIFAAPVILSFAGVPLIEQISFIPILTGTQILQYLASEDGGIFLAVFHMTAAALCILLFLRGVHKRFCR